MAGAWIALTDWKDEATNDPVSFPCVLSGSEDYVGVMSSYTVTEGQTVTKVRATASINLLSSSGALSGGFDFDDYVSLSAGMNAFEVTEFTLPFPEDNKFWAYFEVDASDVGLSAEASFNITNYEIYVEGAEPEVGDWVPLASSSHAYTFTSNADGGDATNFAQLLGSTVMFTSSGIENDDRSTWSLAFGDGTTGPKKVRATFVNYLAGENREGSIYHPARIGRFGSQTTNQADPGAGASNYPDNSGVVAFSPSPVTIMPNSESVAVDTVLYDYTGYSSDNLCADQSFQILIEVWDTGGTPAFWTNFLGTVEK